MLWFSSWIPVCSGGLGAGSVSFHLLKVLVHKDNANANLGDSVMPRAAALTTRLTIPSVGEGQARRDMCTLPVGKEHTPAVWSSPTGPQEPQERLEHTPTPRLSGAL